MSEPTLERNVIIGWKAWFVDKAQDSLISYERSDTSWSELPTDGCLGVVLFETGKKPNGEQLKTTLVGSDYYFKAGEVYGSDVEVRERNIPAEIEKRYTNPVILRGIWTSHDLFDQAQTEMREAQLCL